MVCVCLCVCVGGGGGGGVGFIMGEMENLKVSLHSWQRGANPLIL